MAYWWCTRHNRVEQASSKGWFHGSSRLGPFDTEAEAQRALEIFAERNAKQDAEDEAQADGDAAVDAAEQEAADQCLDDLFEHVVPSSAYRLSQVRMSSSSCPANWSLPPSRWLRP